ncbi:gamma-glutamyltranspeptidase [bacterium MnTg02]|nr:gamma-glutamyltranspeptidase [bacterium MnTg02]
MSGKVKGVVAAGHEITAQAAAEILEDGGNAFDAVLAGMAAACVAETIFSSLGGSGALMAYQAPRGETLLYDFFAQTPKRKRPPDELDFYAIQADFGPATQEFHIGAGSTAVPGFIPGLFAIHGDLCRLPMERIFEPAVRAARNGTKISAFEAYLFTIVESILTACPEAKEVFAPAGRLLVDGESYRNPAFAQTLEALGREGLGLFAEGELGQAIARQSEEPGGHLTLADLSSYEVIRRPPLTWRHRDWEIALNPAPAASGPLIAFGLGLLEKLRPAGAIADPVLLTHVLKATVTARAAAGSAPEQLYQGEMIAEHLKRLEGLSPATRGTTHISVIDSQGNAAGATVTNGEGNGRMTGAFGFMLNNMLGEEDLNPEGFHLWQPDTRLSTMIAPTVMRGPAGQMVVLGSGGSNRIRSAILQTAVNIIDHGLNLEEAVAAPRIHVEKDGHVSFENIFQAAELEQILAAFPDAHGWPDRNLFFGGVHAAQRLSDGTLTGAGDARRAGASIRVE